jgi:hypothetical protein
LWDVYVGGGLGLTVEVVKAPTAEAAMYRVQWELDWNKQRRSVLNAVPSEHPEWWDGLVYTGRHQSVKA